jgi:hypothetical protein
VRTGSLPWPPPCAEALVVKRRLAACAARRSAPVDDIANAFVAKPVQICAPYGVEETRRDVTHGLRQVAYCAPLARWLLIQNILLRASRRVR